MPKLLIVIASTRPGRVGLPVGRWVERQARAHGGFDVDVADLAEINLPLMDEPHHPRLGQYTQAHTRAWSARVDAADAFVFVMPEYNHGYTAPLKNALDYLFREWGDKPAAFVSYGGVSGGLRALQLLKPVILALRMVPAAEVPIPWVGRSVVDGEFRPEEGVEAAARALLDALQGWHATLRGRRTG